MKHWITAQTMSFEIVKQKLCSIHSNGQESLLTVPPCFSLVQQTLRFCNFSSPLKIPIQSLLSGCPSKTAQVKHIFSPAVLSPVPTVTDIVIKGIIGSGASLRVCAIGFQIIILCLILQINTPQNYQRTFSWSFFQKMKKDLANTFGNIGVSLFASFVPNDIYT